MDKRFWAIIGVIVVVIGGIIFFNSGNKAGAPSAKTQPTNHVIGGNAKNVLFVEYGDYQCPFCGQYYPLVQAVVAKYQNDISFQFRHLPLLQIHKNAIAAARAAEAADMQGKFWQMHDKLYTSQSEWSQLDSANSIFEGYAKELGLNVAKFKVDFASSIANDRINADIAAFKKTGQQMSTPSFFLDGKPIKATSVDEFSKLIDAEIAKKAKTTTPATTPATP